MTGNLYRNFREWLRLERSGSPERAERALQRVFSSLPPQPIPDSFADRVLLAAGLAQGTRWESSRVPHWGLRAAISLCLLMVALFLSIIPSYMPALLGIFNLGRATDVGVTVVVGLFHQLGAGLVIWRALTAAGTIVGSMLSSPTYLVALLAAVLISVGALRALHQVILTERSSRYVGSV